MFRVTKKTSSGTHIQDKTKWPIVVSTVINALFPQNAGNFFTHLGTMYLEFICLLVKKLHIALSKEILF